MENSFLTIQIPISLKNEILDIVHNRKLQGKRKETQKSVVIELLEKGLSVLAGNESKKGQKTTAQSNALTNI